MVTPQQLFDEYVQLRSNAFDATSTLQMMRGRIELLPAADRATLVKQVKVWETKHHSSGQTESPNGQIKSLRGTSVPQKGQRVTCSNCGKVNSAGDVFCYSCGYMLHASSSPFATMQLANGEAPDDSYFGPDATLVLLVRGTKKMYRVQPQKQQHEMVMGRGEGGTMQPDIDLADQGAAQLGVSRLHLAIRYSSKHNTVSISDMNSANGTFVNGQRLHPQEVRVLRHGDELRLGRMVFQTLFHQSNS
ncbi:MAG TPA: FHA domain-containing protein [Oceanobacillus sp.]|nr:FHA domain-containing protein [Oceanobacillus sp.]